MKLISQDLLLYYQLIKNQLWTYKNSIEVYHRHATMKEWYRELNGYIITSENLLRLGKAKTNIKLLIYARSLQRSDQLISLHVGYINWYRHRLLYLSIWGFSYKAYKWITQCVFSILIKDFKAIFNLLLLMVTSLQIQLNGILWLNSLSGKTYLKRKSDWK